MQQWPLGARSRRHLTPTRTLNPNSNPNPIPNPNFNSNPNPNPDQGALHAIAGKEPGQRALHKWGGELSAYRRTLTPTLSLTLTLTLTLYPRPNHKP